MKRGKYWHWKYCVDGQRQWESLKTESKRDAELIRQVRIKEYHDDRARFVRDDRNPTFDEFEAVYYPWSEEHKRRKSREIERLFWGQLRTYTNARKLGDVLPRHIEAFKRHLVNTGMNGRPVSKQTANNALRHIQALFNYAVKLELFDGDNPVVKIERFKLPKKAPDFLSMEEVDALMEAAKGHSSKMHLLFGLGIFAGLRKNEIVNTRWDWFDFEEKLIRVKGRADFAIKDNEDRTIPISARLAAVLVPHVQDDGFLFETNRPSQAKSSYRYEPRKSIKAVTEKAGVPRATFQLLRHTFGSQHAIAGTSIYKISKWMGHSSVDVTTKHYAGLQEYDEDIDRF